MGSKVVCIRGPKTEPKYVTVIRRRSGRWEVDEVVRLVNDLAVNVFFDSHVPEYVVLRAAVFRSDVMRVLGGGNNFDHEIVDGVQNISAPFTVPE